MFRTVQFLIACLQKFFVCGLCGKILSQIVNIFVQQLQVGIGGFCCIAGMQDIRTGKIQCIVVKDLSRFGRDYIETGSYLETIFPMLHVRFIAINDDFDNIRQSDVDSLAVPIKNMVNSLYAKDISKKISLSYQMRREKGIPTSWCTPYGYQLNQQGNKLEATEDAKWVKLIYQWYLAGVSTNEIARRLEFLEVARPNERLNRKLHEGDGLHRSRSG